MKKILHVAETIKGGVATVIRTISASPEGDAANYELVYLVPEDQAKELHGIGAQQIRTFPRTGRNVPSLLPISTTKEPGGGSTASHTSWA